ncbi:hypothetical protein [Kitasatospora sp. NPDC059673]|uniref:hypothetical protein n=1 Tax=Kitasatospora sp. NPDC059673 TaxID=3346901 RepID=UPI0036AB3217
MDPRLPAMDSTAGRRRRRSPGRAVREREPRGGPPRGAPSVPGRARHRARREPAADGTPPPSPPPATASPRRRVTAAGHRVTAVEPTAPIRALGRARHVQHPIDRLDDAIPHLPRRTARADRYDLILLTAVRMHLDAEQRPTAMATLARLLAGDGRIVPSLRHGPVPPGRRMFPLDAPETLARTNKPVPLHLAHRDDPHARAGVSRTYLAPHADRPSSPHAGARGLDGDEVSRS